MVWVFDLGDATQSTTSDADGALLDRYARMLADEMPAAAAAKCLSKMLNVSRDAAYQAVLRHRNKA